MTGEMIGIELCLPLSAVTRAAPGVTGEMIGIELSVVAGLVVVVRVHLSAVYQHVVTDQRRRVVCSLTGHRRTIVPAQIDRLIQLRFYSTQNRGPIYKISYDLSLRLS